MDMAWLARLALGGGFYEWHTGYEEYLLLSFALFFIGRRPGIRLVDWVLDGDRHQVQGG